MIIGALPLTEGEIQRGCECPPAYCGKGEVRRG